jgi:enamine deaminase RidA (YjgF/YER057c/UK114 family)
MARTEAYSQAVRVGDLLFTAGLPGSDPKTGAVAARTSNAQASLRKPTCNAGRCRSSMEQVVRVAVSWPTPGPS